MFLGTPYAGNPFEPGQGPGQGPGVAIPPHSSTPASSPLRYGSCSTELAPHRKKGSGCRASARLNARTRGPRVARMRHAAGVRPVL